MADKYLKDNGSHLEEVEAIVISTGATSAGKIVALGSDGKLDPSTYNAGSGSDFNIDGGYPDSIYTPSLFISGGTP